MFTLFQVCLLTDLNISGVQFSLCWVWQLKMVEIKCVFVCGLGFCIWKKKRFVYYNINQDRRVVTGSKLWQVLLHATSQKTLIVLSELMWIKNSYECSCLVLMIARVFLINIINARNFMHALKRKCQDKKNYSFLNINIKIKLLVLW